MKMPRLSIRWSPWWVYGLLALVVLGPLLKPGYILTVDMVFVPHVPPPSSAGPDYPFWFVLHFLSDIVPAWLLQKILLWGIFASGAMGAHRLMEYFKPSKATQDWRWASYFAGVLYLFNPFMYSRFMAGQYLLLAGCAILPWTVRAIWKMAAEPSWRRAFILAALVALTAIASLHVLGFEIVLVLVISALFGWRHRRNTQWLRAYSAQLAAASCLVMLVNIPYVFWHGHTGAVVDAFHPSDLQAFATVPGKWGSIANILALQGFWADARNLYLVPQQMFSWWWLPIIALWGLVLAGIRGSWRYQRGVCLVFGVLGLFAVICALGVSSELTAPLTRWLFTHSGIARGYREPQKFVILLVLIYGYFGGVGLYDAVLLVRRRHWSQDVRQLVITVALSLPILCAPLMLLGFRGQLHAANYPADWYSTRLYLQEHSNPTVLFLPWHLYMHYDFAQRVVASPAPKFFGGSIFSSSDPELRGASAYAQTLQQNNVSKVVAANNGAPTGSQLRSLHIQYVLVAKDFNRDRYQYLLHDPNMQMIQNTQTLQLFKVQGD